MRPRKRHASKGRFSKLFKARNILIVSDHAVEHIPLSPLLQLAVVFGVLGFFSWISYTTGSYMAASSVIQEKEEKIVAASIEKKRIGEEMLMLKRDLVKLNKSGKELTDYDKFVIKQHEAQVEKTGKLIMEDTLFTADNSGGAASATSIVDERLSYLEKRVEELQNDNLEIVMTIYDRTKDKIDVFEDVIAMAGLNADQLKSKALALNRVKARNNATAKVPSKVENLGLNTTAPEAAGKFDNQGGPYIPLSAGDDDFTPEQWEQGLDRLLLLNQVVDAMPLGVPAPLSRTTSGFGRRLDPFRRTWAMHEGLDFAAPRGGKVVAANEGKVIEAHYHPQYGNVIDIDHGLGMTTRYAHLSRLLVKQGQLVKQGEAIGIQGSTGRSTGDHLHYEVRYNDQPLNPMKFLQAGRYVLSKK